MDFAADYLGTEDSLKQKTYTRLPSLLPLCGEASRVCLPAPLDNNRCRLWWSLVDSSLLEPVVQGTLGTGVADGEYNE